MLRSTVSGKFWKNARAIRANPNLAILRKTSNWRIWYFHGVHGLDPYKRVVRKTGRYCCTLGFLCPIIRPLSSNKRWWSVPNALVTLAIRWTVSSSRDPLRFTLLPKYVKDFTYFLGLYHLPSMVPWEILHSGAWLLFYTPLIYLGVGGGWCSTVLHHENIAHVDKLHKWQKRAPRIITNSNFANSNHLGKS